MLLSRCVRLAGRGQSQALVPWADLLNHDVNATCYLDYEPEGGLAGGSAPGPAAVSSSGSGVASGSGRLVLRTDREYLPGQQVCEYSAVEHRAV